MSAEQPGRVPVHRRTLEFEVFDEGSELEVVGHLRDDRPWAEPGTSGVHDMELRVRVRLDDMTITECQAVMHTFPHAECPAIVEAFAGLAGLSVSRGFTRAVQSRVAGPKGCTHLDQLARSLGPVVVQAVTSRRARALREGATGDLLTGSPDSPWARNTCHVWAEGGVAEQKLAAGWRPGRGPYPGSRPRRHPRRGRRDRRPAPARPDRRTRHERRPVPPGRALALLVIALGLVAGCSSSGTAITSPFDTSPPRLEHGPVYEVKVGEVAGLGQVLVDGQGITLYLYATDQQGSPSRCYNLCEVAWPPLVLPTGHSPPGGRTGDQGLAARHAPRGGTAPLQITYNGWPLYAWPQDRAPGQATGQALTNAGGLWYVVDPAGNAVHTASVA